MADLIAGTALLHYTPLVESLGGDPERLLRAQGVDPRAVGDDQRLISYTGVAAAIGMAARDLDCPDFGLKLAVRQGIDILGPVAVLFRNAETLARAVEGVCRYLYHCAPPDRAALNRGAQTAVFTYDIALRQFAHRDQIIEKTFGVTLGAFRLMVGDDFRPVRVTMRHQRISPLARYREFFGCPVEFGASVNGFYFESSLLDRSARMRDAAAFTLAENYLAQSNPHFPLVDAVRETIHRLLGANRAALLPVAEAMAIHPRVLQRRLAEAGTSFEDILDDERRMWTAQLSTGTLGVGEIATMLGYSEQSSFTRACRRWYGMSPRQLITQRRSMSANDAA